MLLIAAAKRALAIAALLSGFSEAPAFADDCPPLMLITSVDLVPSQDNRWQFVPVTLQGKPKLMLVDTGGFVSELTPQAVDELGLHRRMLGFQQINIAGDASNQAADVTSFVLGRLTADSIEFVVAPEQTLFGDDSRVAGIIGPNILRKYDVDLDFGAHKLSLLSQDHCKGKVIYWPASAVAVVPMHVLPSGHIALTVKLDGQDVHALLDTGASNSTLEIPVAETDFHLKLGSPDTPYLAELQDRPGSAVYKHRFASLSFGDIAVSNPQIDIIPDFTNHPLEAHPEIGTRFIDTNVQEEKAPMLLGMNVLRHLHLYIAYKEQNLYITPGGTPPTSAATSAPDATTAASAPH